MSWSEKRNLLRLKLEKHCGIDVQPVDFDGRNIRVACSVQSITCSARQPRWISVRHFKQQRCEKRGICKSCSARKDGCIDKDGYRRIWVVDKRNLGEHRYIMEQSLGRPLLKTETVHHKNGVRSDNRPDNLELKAKAHGAGQRVIDLAHYFEQIGCVILVPIKLAKVIGWKPRSTKAA